MRIISDFHDYYDVGMKNGYDPKLPYKRFRREVDIDFVRMGYKSFGYFHSLADEYHFDFFYIGFAGKIYLAINRSESPDKPDYSFDSDKVDDDYCLWLLEKKMKKDAQKYKYFAPHWRRLRREKDRKEAIAECKKDIYTLFEFRNSKELLNLFERFKTAIFIYQLGNNRIVLNERLNQYGFQKVLPPEAAFQELEMYVGAYLTQPVIEEPPISDKIKAEIHGFDQFSFRKGKNK
ncbi:hypothetical protein FACS189454_03680 [Planctomycetales bacterium]|nr:hypothetical protein FACS189454_03680 [Planctomycetales bacterium]